jgi:hypothetical protein
MTSHIQKQLKELEEENQATQFKSRIFLNVVIEPRLKTVTLKSLNKLEMNGKNS